MNKMKKLDAQLMIEIEENLNNNLVPMLIGEPGSGMLNWINGLAEIMGTQLFCVPCDKLSDKNDLTGVRLVLTDDGKDYRQETCINTDIDAAIKYAQANPHETPILVLDSINSATPDVTTTALAIPSQRHIGGTTFPANLRIIITAHTKDTPWLDVTHLSRFAIKPIE